MIVEFKVGILELLAVLSQNLTQWERGPEPQYHTDFLPHHISPQTSFQTVIASHTHMWTVQPHPSPIYYTASRYCRTVPQAKVCLCVAAVRVLEW